MSRSFELEVHVDHWVKGAGLFRRIWQSGAKARLGMVMERAWEIADRRVHVVTGYLKSTGDFWVEDGEYGPVGVLAYTADYAVYEFARGGDHDAMGPAIVDIADDAIRELAAEAEDVIGTWK